MRFTARISVVNVWKKWLSLLTKPLRTFLKTSYLNVENNRKQPSAAFPLHECCNSTNPVRTPRRMRGSVLVWKRRHRRCKTKHLLPVLLQNLATFSQTLMAKMQQQMGSLITPCLKARKMRDQTKKHSKLCQSTFLLSPRCVLQSQVDFSCWVITIPSHGVVVFSCA